MGRVFFHLTKRQNVRLSDFCRNCKPALSFFFREYKEDFEDETLEKRGCRLYAKRSRKLRRNTFRS